MNIVLVGHDVGAIVSSVVAAIGRTLHVVEPPAAVDRVLRCDPAVVVVDASELGLLGLCGRLKADLRTAAIPVLAIIPPGVAAIDTASCDDLMETPIAPEQLARRLRSWCTLSSAWDRRRTTQASNALLMLRRVAALARRARGVFDEQLLDNARDFAQFLGLDADDSAALEDAALLYDFSDLTLPTMDPDLAATVAQYRPELSESLLSPVVESRRLLGAIRHHDERWDGTGVPDQLHGLAIPRLARILRLLVQFELLIRDGHTIAEAREGVRRDVVAGGSDPELHRAFDRWLLTKDAHQVQS